MKIVKLLLVSLIVLSQTATAQKAINKIVIKTPMAVCDACKDKIETYIMREEGISSVNVDIHKHTTTVVYITDRITDEDIKALLATLGFDADDVTAEETSIKRLPKCCQKDLTKKPAVDSAAIKKP